MAGVKNIWGSNIYYYATLLSLFHFFGTANTQKNKVFFLEFLQEMWMH